MADYTFDQFDVEAERQRARFGESRRMTTGTGGDIVPYDPGNPPTPPQRETRPVSGGGTPIDTTQGAIDAACSLYRRFPDVMTNLAGRNLLIGGRGVFGSNQRNGDRFMRLLCGGDDPETLPVPGQQFTGGQCLVRYTGTWTISGTEGNTPRSLNGNWGLGTAVLFGPITGFGPVLTTAGRYEHRIFGRTQTGQPTSVVVLTIGNAPPNDWKLNSFTITAQRFDGQPDNCGNAPVGYPPQTPSFPQPTVSIPSNGTEVNIPITIQPGAGTENTDNPFLNIDVGGIDVNIDLGGISFGNPSGGGGLTPAQESTINNTQVTVNETQTTVNEIEVDLDEVLQRLNQLETQIGNRFNTVDEVLACIEQLVKKVSPLIPIKDTASRTVCNFSFTREDRVKYCDSGRLGCAFLLIEVEDPVPLGVRLYGLSGDGDDVEAGFGNYSLYRNIVGASSKNNDTFQRLYTKFTLLQLTPGVDFTEGVRLSCAPGTIITVTDLGYTYVPAPVECLPEEPPNV